MYDTFSTILELKKQLAEKDLEIQKLRETNRKLHRRAQEQEAPAQSYEDSLAYVDSAWSKNWHHEFQRVMNSFNECKIIFISLEKVYDYGTLRFHSVMDSHCLNGGMRFADHGVYANLFKDNKVVSYRVADEVKRAVAEIQELRAKCCIKTTV